MNWKAKYEKWQNFPNLDSELKELLTDVKEEILKDSFYKNLEFGTGGMRGEIGPGTNRLNIYTVRKATEGLAQFIEKNGAEAKKRGVVIAYDSRHKSPEFSLEAAQVLGKHGIQTYIFESLRPTPILSFAVRLLKSFSGIVLTASHNPPEYNGYKVYGEDGGQLPPHAADTLIQYVNEIENELNIPVEDVKILKNKGLLKFIGKEVDSTYLEALKGIFINKNLIKEQGMNLSIVFSPLHGTSNVPIQQGLKMMGFNNVTIVKEQELPDPNFSTVKSPNPEEHAAFEMAILYGKQIGADILLATDPDADRLGVSVKNSEGDYIILTGNQTGALMLDYLLAQKQKQGFLPENGVVMKTIVTSEIGRTIASAYGLKTIDTLTGFKFIGEKINEFERTKEYQFLFGYEESYGYLIGDFVRDKDAIQAALFICEVATYYKSQGKTLYDGLIEIFEKYGYYYEDLVSITLKGVDGAEKIETMMAAFRDHPPKTVAGIKVLAIEDYKLQEKIDLETNSKEKLLLPSSNVLKYWLEDGSWFCLRPSGTEPKIKFYFGVEGNHQDEATKKLEQLKKDVLCSENNQLLPTSPNSSTITSS